MAKFNTRQLIDAMEKNGYKKTKGEWVRFGPDGEVKSACAIGQALLNLGVKPHSAESVNPYLPVGLTNPVMDKNDKYGDRSMVSTIARSFKNTDWYTNPTDFEIPDYALEHYALVE